jgi:hypothetical protein
VQREAIIQSALLSANLAEEIGLPRDKHHPVGQGQRRAGSDRGLSDLAARCDYALHLGLTEAGMGSKGIVASSAAMGILLQQGIGDTIRVSLTPEPGGDRTREVQVAQELLQTMGFRQFVPVVAACPGCGRTTSTCSRNWPRTSRITSRLDMPEWREELAIPASSAVGRGDGLHRQRPGREQARRYRHLAARHRRDAGGAGLHRRQEGRDAARRRCRRAVQGWSPTISSSGSVSGGATSATTAGACAAGALSLKYAVQTALGSKKRAPERKADEPSVDTNQSDGKPKTDSARKRKIRP